MRSHFLKRTEDPTPEEIEAACAEIRRSWSADERRNRWIGPYGAPWEPPVVSGAPLHSTGLDDDSD